MIELSIVPRRLQLEDGAVARATVTVRNTGLAPITVSITMDGPQADWCTVDQPGMTVSPNNTSQSQITVHPPIGSTVGDHDVEVIAASAGESARGTLLVHIDGMDEDDGVEAPAALTATAAVAGRRSLFGRRALVAIAALLVLMLGAGTALVMRNRSAHRAGTAHCGIASVTPATADSNCEGTASPAAVHHTPTVASPTASARPSPTASPVPATPTPTARQRLAKALKPGFPGSPRHYPRHTATPTSSPTRRPTPTVTGTPPATGTPAPTNTVTDTRTPTATMTPTNTATDTSTPTVTPTATDSGTPTLSPTPTRTFTPSATLTPSVTVTPTISPTPAEVGLLYNYALGRTGVTISWRTTFASSFAIDGTSEPLSGSRTFPLRTHVFVLSALSLDKTQSRLQAVAIVVNQCNIRVNDQRVNVPGVDCLNGEPLPTPTATASMTPLPTAVVTPVANPRRRSRAGVTPSSATGAGTPTTTPTP